LLACIDQSAYSSAAFCYCRDHTPSRLSRRYSPLCMLNHRTLAAPQPEPSFNQCRKFNVALSCGAAWRGLCSCTGSGRTYRQLQGVVSWRVATHCSSSLLEPPFSRSLVPHSPSSLGGGRTSSSPDSVFPIVPRVFRMSPPITSPNDNQPYAMPSA